MRASGVSPAVVSARAESSSRGVSHPTARDMGPSCHATGKNGVPGWHAGGRCETEVGHAAGDGCRECAHDLRGRAPRPGQEPMVRCRHHHAEAGGARFGRDAHGPRRELRVGPVLHQHRPQADDAATCRDQRVECNDGGSCRIAGWRGHRRDQRWQGDADRLHLVTGGYTAVAGAPQRVESRPDG